MNNILVSILTIAFLIRTIRNIFALTYLWQLKEYRFDRVWVHIKETATGRELILGRETLIKWFLVLFYPVTYINTIAGFLFPTFVFLTFIVEIVKGRYKGFKRPVPTIKAYFIIISTIILQIFLLNLPLFEIAFWVLILDRTLPIFIAAVVLFLSLPTELVRDIKILQAKKLLGRRRPLIIGITGSYGKSSTKEFIGQVLSYRFRVLATPGTNNTPIGIANTVLAGLKKNPQIFVVEMGAYKIGEIAQLCQIARPKIGVLTGIAPQHLSLFGSIENIIEGKYELIESLPKDGLAIFNGNNEYCHSLYEKTKIKKLLYSSDGGGSVEISKVKANRLDISFNLKINAREERIKVKLLGRHNVENLLPAILIAKYLGMEWDEIKQALENISYLPMTMEPYKGKTGSILIDDTFNASPQSVISAISYMKVFKGKRILVLQPMIELGKEAKIAHYNVGVAGRILSRVFLTNKNFYKDFRRGADEGAHLLDRRGAGNKVKVATIDEIAKFIEKNTKSGDVVVFEGKEAAGALKEVLSLKP